MVIRMKSFFDGKRALVVINPIAGKRSTKTQLFNITELFSIGGLETTVYTTRRKGDATDIVRSRGGNYDIIVCRGGDGTFNEVINGMMQLEKRPLVGYIPAGSTNDLARTLCIPSGDNDEAIDIILNGQPLWNDIGSFNGSLYWCYTASFGAFTEVSYGTPQRLKNQLGHAAYVVAAAAAIKDIRPIPVHIKTAEGYEAEEDVIFCGVSNSVSMAGSLKIRRREVGLNDGLFELIKIRYPRSFSELVQRISLALARDYRHDEVKMVRTRHAQFTFEEGVPWTVDGEYGGTHESVVIENIHNAVQVFRG
jgi:YegS/Rv2252/BmrU family lipid kinase